MEQGVDLLTGAARLEHVEFSKIRIVMDQVAGLRTQGVEVLSLSAGEPDFSTPQPIKDAAARALADNYTHYGSNRGDPKLRAATAKMIRRETGVSYDPETEILITTGGAEALNNAFMALVDPGDEVIIFSPAFISYENLVRMCGGIVVNLPLKGKNEFQIDVDELAAAITPRTKLLVMNNPNNPTGAVYTKESLEKVCCLARENNFLILSDEMYSQLIYGDAKFYSIASFPEMKERTVIINGFSKTYAMTGWRVGYVTAPARLLTQILKVHQYCSTSGTTFIQVGLAESILLEETEKAAKQMAAHFSARREILVEGLDRIPEISYVKPQGAFYVMADVSALGMDGDTFAAGLLAQKHVAVVPGSGLGKDFSDYVRISFAASEDTIRRGLALMGEYVRECKAIRQNS